MKTQEPVKERYVEILYKLSEVSIKILETDDIEEQLSIIAHSITELNLFRRALLSIFDEKWRIVKFGFSGLDDIDVGKLKNKRFLSKEERDNIFSDRFRISKSYYVPHYVSDSENIIEDDRIIDSKLEKNNFVDWHPDDILLIPLYGKNNKILGTISVDDPNDGRKPSTEKLQVLELFANQAGIAIEKNLMFWQNKKQEILIKNFIE